VSPEQTRHFQQAVKKSPSGRWFLWSGKEMGCKRLALALGVVLAVTAFAREYEVRLLRGTERSGVWGTGEFEVAVNEYGAVRMVKVGGAEYFSQAAVLYTSPVPPGAANGIRAVQGEGVGARGLGPEKPTMRTSQAGGGRVFEFETVIARPEILDGAPVCRVNQKVAVLSTGEIRVGYDLEWLQTVRWDHVMLLLLLDQKQCHGREYMALAGDSVYAGVMEPGPATERRLRGVPLDQLTLRLDKGPCPIVLDEPSVCEFSWGGGVQLSIRPTEAARKGFIYAGQKARFSFRILLPVSQQ